jgi:Flp pilus assembly protein TadG
MSAARIDRLHLHDSGSVAVETALAFTLMMSCVIAIVEFCLMLFTYGVYADAARYGVRYATIHGADSTNCSGPTTGCGDPNATNVVNQVVQYAKAYTAPVAGASVQVTYPDPTGCTPPSRVIVTVTYTYGEIFPAPLKNIAFQVSSQGRILY